MLTRTGLAVITDALKLIGVVAGHEVPTSAEQTDSFARLNELIDSWGVHAQTLLVQRREVVALVVGQQVYAIAPGEDFDLPTPLTLDAVSVILPGATPPIERLLGAVTDAAQIGTPVKALPGPPLFFNYTRTHAGGDLWIWPVPAVVQPLVLYWHDALAQFPDLTTPVTLAAGYAKALRTNLALELAPEFGRTVDPLVLRMAAESLADIKRANVALVEIGMDPAVTVGPGYNILTDG
jgi:hypothetical protein